MTLSDEMSRWTTPSLCAALSAEAMRFCRTRTSASGSGPDASRLGQRRAVDELHREIGALDVRIDRKHEIANDRVVNEIVEDRRLAPEQLHHLWVVRKLGANHLDRHDVPVWMLNPR